MKVKILLSILLLVMLAGLLALAVASTPLTFPPKFALPTPSKDIETVHTYGIALIATCSLGLLLVLIDGLRRKKR
jgi:hypothetical protein